ncbi:MAG TPA: ABC transporter permease [Capsulimonadaceae bacterium]|jgi:phospholipid/cholesterol/gamma-HCH transport system permease protein
MAASQANRPTTTYILTPFTWLRDLLTRTFVYLGEIAILVARSMRYIFSGAIDPADLIQQMATIGVNSVPIAVLTTFSSAAVIALYFSNFLIQYGAADLTGAIVALSLGRELAPVLVGVVVAARAGSAIAAEIGTMKVTEQIDALRALAVSPIQYLIVPRLLAALIMMPVLCAVADFAGLIGGYLISVWQGVPSSSFPDAIRAYCEPRDFYLGMVKTVFFGLIIALVGCHQGFETKGGATGVGRATTNAVVLSIVFIYITNFVLAYIMFGGRID